MTNERRADAAETAVEAPGRPAVEAPGRRMVEEAGRRTVEEAIQPLAAGDASLLALIDRLAALLERSELDELEVEAGGTALVLRKPSALAAATVAAHPTAPNVGAAVGGSGLAAGGHGGDRDGTDPDGASARPSVKAPLTGIFYNTPAPGSAPFVSPGSEVAVGTVIGLIEAMKLFNEIKSDLAGRVVRVVAENGALVKAKQPLIEVEPL